MNPPQLFIGNLCNIILWLMSVILRIENIDKWMMTTDSETDWHDNHVQFLSTFISYKLKMKSTREHHPSGLYNQHEHSHQAVHASSSERR